MVFSMPFMTSTTPEIFLMVSATLGAHVRSSAGSWENRLMAIGSRRARQVANHVLERLRELDIEQRFLLIDLFARLGNDFLNRRGCACASI